MSGAMMLILAKGEAKKFKAFCEATFKKLTGYRPDYLDYVCVAPQLPGAKDGATAHCWIQIEKNKVNIEYPMANICSEWAKTIGKEIIKNFKVKKAGWDSVGYCAMEEVIECRPFDYEKNVLPVKAKKTYIEFQRIYEEHAANIFRPLVWHKHTTNIFRTLGKETTDA